MSLLTSGLYTSCKSAGEKAGEKAMESALEKQTGEDANVDIKGDEVLVETGNTRTTLNTAAKKWPEAIPDEVPEFSWGVIYSVSETDVDGTKSFGIHFKEVPSESVEKYDALLKKNGFKTMRLTIDAGGTITAEKGNLQVTAIVGEDYSQISVQIRPE